MCSVAAGMIAGFFWGCSDDSPTSDTKTTGGDEITTGAGKTYTVDSAVSLEMKDTVSGMTFSFPEGGSGTLSVAPVTSSPDVGVETTKVAVSYTGDETVEVLVPRTEGGEEIAFVYSRRTGIMVDNFDGEYSWWGVPSSGERDGSVVFPISPLMVDAGTAKIAAGASQSPIRATGGAVGRPIRSS